MKIFYACPESHQFFSQLKKADVQNILLSYAYFKSIAGYQKQSGNWYPPNILIDSGAFTVWSKQEKISIDEYLKFIDLFKEFAPEGVNIRIVNLDVLPGKLGIRPTKEEAEKSASGGWQNMLEIENRGYKPLPVFHQHEDFKWLKKMAEHTDYIGISPANDVSLQEKMKWLDRVFYRIKDKVMNEGLKTHGFAVTGYEQMLRYPFYSVDSSSWVVGGKFGTVMTYKNGRFRKIHFKDKDKFSEMWNTSQNKDVNMLDDYKSRNYQCILSYQDMEKFITKLWEKRGLDWDNTPH